YGQYELYWEDATTFFDVTYDSTTEPGYDYSIYSIFPGAGSTSLIIQRFPPSDFGGLGGVHS
ncbi:MAG: hypothetical protein ACREH8_15640, partial [Opitutaceae bacterium]